MGIRPWTSAAALALVATAGCIEPSATPGFDDPGTEPVNRLVVIDNDNNVVTLAPDGSSSDAITSDAGNDLWYVQPTWSPDARRIAFGQIAIRDRLLRSELVATNADGSGRIGAETQLRPIYIHWDPTSERVAFIGRSPAGLELRLLDPVEAASEPRTLVFGTPIYFSWAGDGRELLAHSRAGTQRGSLDRVTLDGDERPIEANPGLFQAPDWSASQDRVVYAARSGGSQRLVVADPDGTVHQSIARMDGLVTFSMDPTGQLLAFVVDDLAGRDAQLRAAGMGPGPQEDHVAAGTLFVADLDAQSRETVTEDSVAMLQWAPNGDALLFATLDAAGAVPAIRWNVWDGDQVHSYERTVPTAMFAQDYLPFYDQYSRSMTLWSPDSTAFAYAASDDDGAGIWVQRLDDERPLRVADGKIVAWSPR